MSKSSTKPPKQRKAPALAKSDRGGCSRQFHGYYGFPVLLVYGCGGDSGLIPEWPQVVRQPGRSDDLARETNDKQIVGWFDRDPCMIAVIETGKYGIGFSRRQWLHFDLLGQGPFCAALH